MSLHEDLINELLYGNVALTPRENAARLEILKLREKPLETETPKAKPEKAEVANKHK